METILMSRRERHRLEMFSKVRRGEITLMKASELLGLSYRQAKRCFERYREEGDKGLVHRRLSRGLDLARVLSIRETRVVQNDWTLRFENRWYQLAQTHQKLALAGREVTVSQRLDGGLELFYGSRELNYRELSASPPGCQDAREAMIRSNQGQRPAADHPWRRGLPGAHRRCGRVGPASLWLATLASAPPAPTLSCSNLRPKGHF
jgi:hypothetical protein